MKKIFIVLALSLAVLVPPAVTLAAEFRTSENGSVDLLKDQSAKNLYIAGNTVNVSGTAKGDLTVAGNTLNLNGPVEDSLFAVGNIINLSGIVNKNARIAGSSINIISSIKEDLIVGAAALTISPEATIGGDLIAGVGDLSLSAPVSGNVKISGSEIIIDSKINGDVTVYATKGLILGDKANIGGSLTYRSPEEAQISSSAVVSGKTDYTKMETKSYTENNFAGALGIFGFLGFLMGLALLLFVVYLLPKSSLDLVKNTLDSFWSNLGWGFLISIAGPIALIIIASTILGLKIAGILFLLYLGFIIVSSIFATLAIGAQILKWIQKKDYCVDWLTILIGTFASLIISLIPVMGGLIIWLVSAAVLGQLVKHIGPYLKSQR